MGHRSALPQLEVASANKKIKILDLDDPCASIPNSVWNDYQNVIENKMDGHRFKLHVFATENRLDSRRQSVDGGLFVEKTDHAPAVRDYLMPELVGTIFDGELCAGQDSNSIAHALGSMATPEEKASITYIVFDILFFKGTDVRDRPDRVRRTLIEMCFNKTSLGRAPMIKLMPRRMMAPDEKRAALIASLDAGQEGVMIKDVSKPYGKGWTKVKREARYDVVVMGYDEPEQFSIKKGDAEPTETKFHKLGWIGAVKFGQYRDGKLVAFGQTSGMSNDVRREISEDRQGHIGRVFEIAAQERFPTGKFRHPRFIRWRTNEKLAVDCVYDPDEA